MFKKTTQSRPDLSRVKKNSFKMIVECVRKCQQLLGTTQEGGHSIPMGHSQKKPVNTWTVPIKVPSI